MCRGGRKDRIEQLSLDDPKKKIVSGRESTISPAIASSRYPLFLPIAMFVWGAFPLDADRFSAATRGKGHRRRGAIYSIASLLVCLLQPAKFPLFTQLPA